MLGLVLYLIKVFEKYSQCHLFLYQVFYVLSMNTQKLLHPLIKHIHEVLQQVNHEEYSQKPWRDSSIPGFFPVFYMS